MGKNLRTQFMGYMTLNRFSLWTIKNYMSTMTRLAKYYNKSPDQLTNEEIQEYRDRADNNTTKTMTVQYAEETRIYS